MTGLATYDASTTPTLRFERTLNHPVEAVWHAITDPDELTHWFPSVIEGRPAHGVELRFVFSDHPEVEPMTGAVTACEPPHVLAFAWGEDHLRFELEPIEAGTRLTFTVALGTADKAARDGAGWHVCLDRIATHLDRDGEAGEWQPLYDEYQRRGFPATAPIPGRQ
jgi:uncharacterized protein YndB with AHSA1/START domain